LDKHFPQINLNAPTVKVVLILTMFGQLYVFTIRYVGLGTLSSELSYFPASNPPHNMYAVLRCVLACGTLV